MGLGQQECEANMKKALIDQLVDLCEINNHNKKANEIISQLRDLERIVQAFIKKAPVEKDNHGRK
jgi:hypothetical protein